MWKTFGAICSVIVLVSLLLMNTACYGPFNLTRSVHNTGRGDTVFSVL